MKDLPLRALVASALLALLALVLLFGGWFQAAVLGLFSALAVHEMASCFRAKGIRPVILPQLLLGAGMFALMHAFGAVLLPAAFAVCFFVIAGERVFNKKRSNEDVVAAVFTLVYPLALLLCFGLVGFDRADESRLALVCIFAGVAMADNTAYMLGSLIGRHKLCPDISPKKTVEGALGGLVGGALGGVIAYFMQRLWGFEFPVLHLVALCFFGGLVGQIGDLFASTFKRWAGVKDFGRIFPGHGGIIDRLDSAMFAAPLVLLAMHLFIK